jgi:hypothetical protein
LAWALGFGFSVAARFYRSHRSVLISSFLRSGATAGGMVPVLSIMFLVSTPRRGKLQLIWDDKLHRK